MLLTGLVAAATVALGAPRVITSPHWLERPTGNDIAKAYPDRAQSAGISGKAVLYCSVGPDGRLDLCRVFAEAPTGLGFGAAALSLAPKFRMAPPDQPEPDVEPDIFIPILMHINDDPGPKQLVLEAPLWESAPTFDDLAKVFPPGAKASDADVVLRCRVDPDSGGMGACETRTERPGGQGFGSAGLSLANRFQADLGPWRLAPQSLQTAILSADIKIHFRDPGKDGGRDGQVVQPTWLKGLDQDQAAALFPPPAAAKGLATGRGVASCIAAPDGRLRDCIPLAADPEGLGFSEAAVKIASTLRMSPWTRDGRPVDGERVRLPIRFDLTGRAP